VPYPSGAHCRLNGKFPVDLKVRNDLAYFPELHRKGNSFLKMDLGVKKIYLCHGNFEKNKLVCLSLVSLLSLGYYLRVRR
jgi:hypothetical protein